MCTYITRIGVWLSLLQVVCNKGLKAESAAWVRWLENDEVPNEAKLDQLHYTNQDGWSALHYAAYYYRPDILTAAIQVDDGDYMHTVQCVHCVNCSLQCHMSVHLCAVLVAYLVVSWCHALPGTYRATVACTCSASRPALQLQ